MVQETYRFTLLIDGEYAQMGIFPSSLTNFMGTILASLRSGYPGMPLCQIKGSNLHYTTVRMLSYDSCDATNVFYSVRFDVMRAVGAGAE
ncbi:MAG: hypothetical protein HKL84_09740 [Acidimicrobiaceae bacterium]|nr:hypothetical protein [Acidimicrobiaceae bacterium]